MQEAIKSLNVLVEKTADEILRKENTYLDALEVVKQDKYLNNQNELKIEFLNAVESSIKQQAFKQIIE